MSGQDTLAGILGRAARRAADHPALLCGGAAASYAELARGAAALQTVLREQRVVRGDVVSLFAGNGAAFVTAHYAAVSMGAVVAPVNVQFRGALLSSNLDETGSRILVTTPELARAVDRAVPRPARIEEVVVVGEGGGGGLLDVRCVEIGSGAADTPTALDAPAAELELTAAPGDAAALYLTSGTTGRPKQILVTHEQALHGARVWSERWSFGPATVAMMAAPFFHIVYNPMVLGTHLASGTSVALGGLSLAQACSEIVQRGVTALMVPPGLLIQALDEEGSAMDTLRRLDTLIFGSAPTPAPVIRRLRGSLPAVRLFNCYGLTETCSAVSCMGPEEIDGHEDSVGRPHRGVELSIRDESGNEVAGGERGEVCCRGPNVIRSYHGRPLSERFFGDWLRTGDVGHIDPDGLLRLVDRADDVINVGGEKVYPRDVEEVLFAHPEVSEAVVVRSRHRISGDVAKAFVVPAEGCRPKTSSLRRYCAGRLPGYAVPSSITLVPSIPRSPAGKVLKNELA